MSRIHHSEVTLGLEFMKLWIANYGDLADLTLSGGDGLNLWEAVEEKQCGDNEYPDQIDLDWDNAYFTEDGLNVPYKVTIESEELIHAVEEDISKRCPHCNHGL